MLHNLSRILVVVALLVPASAVWAGQPKAGAVIVENNTDVSIRLEGGFYIDANGTRKNMAEHWILAPRTHTRLALAADPKNPFMAREFHFTIITAEGQSQGWNFKTINASGDMRMSLNADTLAKHRELANGGKVPPKVTTFRPNLPQQPPPNDGQTERVRQLDASIANAQANIQRGQNDLSAMNNKLLAANGALVLANAAYERANTDGEKIVTGIALVAARRFVDELIAERRRIESELQANRDLHSRLRNERLSLGR